MNRKRINTGIGLTYAHVVSGTRIFEETVTTEVPGACPQTWFQRGHASQLEEIRFLHVGATEFLKLLQPTAQHRFDTLVHL